MLDNHVRNQNEACRALALTILYNAIERLRRENSYDASYAAGFLMGAHEAVMNEERHAYNLRAGMFVQVEELRRRQK